MGVADAAAAALAGCKSTAHAPSSAIAALGGGGGRGVGAQNFCSSMLKKRVAENEA